MNRWVRVGLLTALIEALRGEPDPPPRTREPAPGPPSDPGEFDRLMTSFAKSLNSAAQALEKSIEASAAADRAIDEEMMKLQALAEESIRARAGESADTGESRNPAPGGEDAEHPDAEATSPRASRPARAPRRRSPRRPPRTS